MNRLVFVALLLTASSLCAQPAGSVLRWGGDKNGGGPFVYEDDGKLVGFEAEFAALLGRELLRSPIFVQNQWDNVPELLKRPNQGRDDDIDIALNGFEFSKERHAELPTTVPYYIYTFRLIARKDNAAIDSWATLNKQEEGKPRRRVGVLRGTASQRYLEQRYGETIEIVPSETVDEMLGEVVKQRIDATVQDSPAAVYYVNQGRFPELHVVDEPVGTGYYVILTRPEDGALREKLNAAIRKSIASGELKAIYQKHGIWNAAQQRLAYLAQQSWPEVAEELGEDDARDRPRTTIRFSAMLGNLVRAAGMTALLAVTSFPLAILFGIAVALARVYGPWPVRFLAAAYVEVLRGTPLLLQLFVIYYLLPEIGKLSGSDWLISITSLPPFAAAVLGLALNYSANEAENYRAGIQAVPAGQTEAAMSLGMSRATTIRRIILPQAMRIVIPPVTNDFIALFKDTAICSSILIVELTGLYYQYKTYPGVVVELAVAVAALYLLMSYPLSLAAQWLERRYSPSGGEGARP